MVRAIQTQTADSTHSTAADLKDGLAQDICNAAEWLHLSVVAECWDVSLYSSLILFQTIYSICSQPNICCFLHKPQFLEIGSSPGENQLSQNCGQPAYQASLRIPLPARLDNERGFSDWKENSWLLQAWKLGPSRTSTLQEIMIFIMYEVQCSVQVFFQVHYFEKENLLGEKHHLKRAAHRYLQADAFACFQLKVLLFWEWGGLCSFDTAGGVVQPQFCWAAGGQASSVQCRSSPG